MSRKCLLRDILDKPYKHEQMKLGRHFFKKNQAIWSRPLIAYDETKMDALFSEIQKAEGDETGTLLSNTTDNRVSLETELYLILHS